MHPRTLAIPFEGAWPHYLQPVGSCRKDRNSPTGDKREIHTCLVSFGDNKNAALKV